MSEVCIISQFAVRSSQFAVRSSQSVRALHSSLTYLLHLFSKNFPEEIVP
ncbi:MAG: hypothetical protein IJS28_06405 [Synergistaceae bacterium]|nr:hypothetical protein [Synergistaceae bacterium]